MIDCVVQRMGGNKFPYSTFNLEIDVTFCIPTKRTPCYVENGKG